MRIILALSMIGLIGIESGCATCVKGANQQIALTSAQAGATVNIDGKACGITPTVAKMARRKAHTVQFTMEGHQTLEVPITKRTSGWIWGNILIGGLIGLIVDLSTGASNNLSPDNVHAILEPGESELRSRAESRPDA